MPRTTIAPQGAKERWTMQREALYVVSDLGRERFIWATSAAEARARASLARATEPTSATHGQTLVLGTAPSRPVERRVRHEAVAAR
jgi:hypothetical protein